jgi:thiopeptide-type bacteriocin biosynthesis protein
MDNIQRTFIIGASWSYFKLYTGFKTADKILTEQIFPLSQELLKNRIIDKWFFIRYSDPKFHLRIRFHVDDNFKNVILLNEFNNVVKSYVIDGLIWKVQADTYNRELERYGITNMENSEYLFWCDSEMICNILSLHDVKQDENIRWMLALKMINVLLDSFQYTLEEKSDLLKTMQENFAKEFGITHDYKKQFAQKYRTERTKIESILESDNDSNWFHPLYEKQERIKNTVNEILCIAGRGEEKNTLLSSYIHMMINRLFRTQQRKYELVLYDFLSMYYHSKIARMSKNHE